MLKQLSFITIILSSWGGTTMPQSIYADIASEMAKEGINQAEAKLNQLPEMLKKGLDIATSEREFESNEFCLGNVQALINMGVVTANIMPFTNVWTYEDFRGPVGKLRVMLNGQKIHTEVYCDGRTLKSKILPWGDGDKVPQEVNMSSFSALLGVGLNFQLQGIFDQLNKEDVKSTIGEVKKSNTKQLTNTTIEPTENIKQIFQKIKYCYNIPLDVGNDVPEVIIGFTLDIDGNLTEEPINLSIETGDEMVKAFEAARRALFRCQPYELPTESFETWREIQLIINPSNMMLQ